MKKRKRRKLERRWRESGTEADKLQYADQCSRVRKLLKSSKMSYYASLINENKSDSKVLFNTIDCIIRLKTTFHPVALQRNYVISSLTFSATKL